ncbi:S1C family serine protease, partial [Nostocoides japonicum]|uniref:S1C family serine protease n=1 Tax=Nostocoides japonicum TaxID=99481 RepID=UPI0009F89C29
PTPEPGATARPAGSVAAIAAKALPSVVTLQVSGPGGSDTGSGWVFDDQGHIVTNNHVVEAAASSGKVTVILSNGKHVDATIVGRDEAYDLAVVKVTGVTLTRLPIGDSDDAVVGDQVIAVGAPLGLDSTVTTGIVSALNRPVSAGGGGSSQSFINAIQTDAAINPGNSGGPLLNMSGQVIGVNAAIAALPSGSGGGSTGSIGLGFAIPSNQVAKTAEQLIRTGKAQHPVIGVYLDPAYDGEGVKIATSGPDNAPAVAKDGPAAKAGLKAGDVILAFDGRPISSNDELVVAIRAKSVGDEVTLHVRRGGKEFDVRMTLQAGE